MPKFKWREDDAAHSLMFFPFVGVLIGACICVLNLVSPISALPVAVRILLTIAIPLIITGGFHADGFMDTSDALHSYAAREKKLEILKDPHIGAFAVISFIKWLLIKSAAVTAIFLNEKTNCRIVILFGMIFVMSRCLSGITAIVFTKAKKDGMLYEETKKDNRGILVFLIIQTVISCAVMLFLNIIYAAFMIAAFLLFTVYYRYRSYKEFGGVTGDTAGYFVTMSEILAMIVLAICGYTFCGAAWQ